MTTEAIEAFHKHLDRCSQCRNHPFNLCAVGSPLLTAAAAQDGRPLHRDTAIDYGSTNELIAEVALLLLSTKTPHLPRARA